MENDPKKYIHLWTNKFVDIFFVSLTIHDELKKNDALVFYDSKKLMVHYFLSKKDFDRYGDYGFQLLGEKYGEFRKNLVNAVERSELDIEKIMKIELAKFSDEELFEYFSNSISICQESLSLYFLTEQFVINKIEKRVREKSFDILYKKNISDLAKTKLWARGRINNYWLGQRKGIFEKYIDEIESRKEKKYFSWLPYSEVLDCLTGKESRSESKKGLDWFFSRESDWRVISGQGASRLVKKFNKAFFDIKNIKEIRGKTGNSGSCIGRVKILQTIFDYKERQKEIKKLRKGDVLVATTTGPEIIKACHLAGAIVTDAGGITSHAAVISRELDKPCVIGTKVATQILQDGDEVEVDASRGIVRIMNKK